MKSKFLSLIFLALCLGITTSCVTKNKNTSSFKIAPFKTVVLKNGLKVLLIEDKKLPYISFNLMVQTGISSDPVEQLGLANLVTELLDQGTQKRRALEITDSFAEVGAEFSTSASRDYIFVSASSLSFHRDKVLNLFSEIITMPSFPEKEISRLKKSLSARIQKIVDHPQSFAAKFYNEYIFSGGHSYAKPNMGTKKTIMNIQKKHINKFYLKYFRPKKSLLSVVGQFGDQSQEDIVAILEKAFAGWQGGKEEVFKEETFPEIKGRHVKLVYKEDLVQSQILLGLKGVRRNNPDYLKIKLANTILGGAFSSRLSNQIRKKMGLTYSISSSFNALKNVGAFTIRTFTRNEKLQTTVNESIKVLEKFYNDGVSDKEVEAAKGLLKGSFPRAIETSEKLAFNIMFLKMHGISEDYLSSFINKVDGFSSKDINETIKKYFNPKNMKIFVYSTKLAEKSLASFGKVESVSYKELL